MVHPLRGVRCRLLRVSRGRGNLRAQVHGRRFRLRDSRSSPPDVAGSPRSSRGPVRPAPSNRDRHRAEVDRRRRVGVCPRRDRGSRCVRAPDRFLSSSDRLRCFPAHPRIVHRAARRVLRVPPIAAHRVPTPRAGCSPVRRTARSRRQSGSPRRGQLHLLPARPVVPPRADRPLPLPRVAPVAEPVVAAGSGASRGA